MPKQDINYDITYFYKIVCRDLTIQDCYVGHTTNFRIRQMVIQLHATIQMQEITIPMYIVLFVITVVGIILI